MHAPVDDAGSCRTVVGADTHIPADRETAVTRRHTALPTDQLDQSAQVSGGLLAFTLWKLIQQVLETGLPGRLLAPTHPLRVVCGNLSEGSCRPVQAYESYLG